MAQILIDDYDLDDLPDICAKCGAPAVTRKKKQFSWHPQWIFVLILVHILVYIIVALIMTKRKTVHVPLCADHKGHWLWRNLVIFGGLLALGFIFVGGIIALEAAGQQQAQDELLGLVCMGGVLGAIIWLVAVLIMQSTAIRPQEITDNSITLKGVAEGFAHACEDNWLYEEDRLDRTVRERWRGPQRSRGPARYAREDDEDDYPPRGEERYRKG
jgi:hypothetical protein